MERNFFVVLKQILAVAPKELRADLERSYPFWAPEVQWFNLSRYVNMYLKPSSKDKTSIKVYAILCGCSEEKMKAQFEADGI